LLHLSESFGNRYENWAVARKQRETETALISFRKIPNILLPCLRHKEIADWLVLLLESGAKCKLSLVATKMCGEIQTISCYNWDTRELILNFNVSKTQERFG
jgi:hypothetical protein